MFNPQVNEMLVQGVKDTLYMTLGSAALGYAIGLPMGVTLAVTGKDGLKPNAFIYRIFDLIANIIRSIPFLILLIIMIPLTRLIVGQSYGATATIIPLVVTSAPYIARLVESSLKEVDTGVIEAARSMGASDVFSGYFWLKPEHRLFWEQRSQQEQYSAIPQWQEQSAAVDLVISR